MLKYLLILALALSLVFIGNGRISYAQEVATGKIIIILDTDPESSGIVFNFDLDPGPNFSLEDDDSITLTLVPGLYSIQQDATAGWDLSAIDCDSNNVFERRGGRILILLHPEERIVCTFNNVPLPTPTPTAVVPTPTPFIVPTPQIVFVPVPGPTQIVERIVTVTPAAISPPKTGDGGLR